MLDINVVSAASLLPEDLDRHVVSFDQAAASAAALLAAQRQKARRTVDMRDTQIAGIPGAGFCCPCRCCRP